MRRVIQFYGVSDEVRRVSNFAPFPIQLGRQVWLTAEHYFQAQKFAGTEHAEAIRKNALAHDRRPHGPGSQKARRRDWEAVKDGVMRQAVRAKITQHPELSALLLATGDALLVEHTDNDSYWGDGGDGSGKNMLGRILMQMRDELRQGGPARSEAR